MTIKTSAVVLSGILLIASCNSSSTEVPAGGAEPANLTAITLNSSTASVGVASGGRQPAPDVQALTVEVKNMKYTPASLTVRVGDTVLWRFKDTARHDVVGVGEATALSPVLQSSLMATGEYRYTFTRVGTFSYTCTIHPSMSGTVIVEP
ncbi:MAG: plastocyanin/azurin family copper-binding protein [Mycobacteriaceae bacterium]